MGRTYKRESRGPSAGQEILSGEVTFNPRGGVLTSTAPRYTGATAYQTSYEYDALDRRTKTTLPDLNEITQSYGLRETYVTNPEGDITGEARNETGLVRYTIEYLGATPIVTSITTNLTARTETTQDHHGNIWVSQLNSLGQVMSLSDPDSGTETREYNDAFEMTAVVNALSERTELTYDLLGRLLTKTTRAGTGGAELTTFTYDEARTGYYNKGFQTTMTDVAGTLKSDFDALGRPARTERTIDSVPYTSTTSYNTAGLPSSTTYPDSQSISWTYDAAGRLSTETGTLTASTYDAAGRPLSKSFSNGVVTTYQFSPTRGWIENIQALKDTTVHQDLTYQYYPDGMIQSVTSAKSMESWGYAYDDLNRLLTATNVDTPSLSQSFTYDEIGNITYNSHIGTYTYPATGNPRPHAVSTAGSRTYQYNAAGQMTNRNGTVIQWNGDGKPSSIGNVGFVYDGVGTRLKKLSGGQTTKYLGGDYEIASDGTVTKYLVGGKQVGTSFFIHHRDHLGSIQAVTDATGAEVRRQKHKPFGDQHYAWGSHLESKGWIDEREEETELLYLNARFYDPEISRFISPDPIVLPGQLLNRYTYSVNNPMTFKDPTGLVFNFDEEGGGGGGPGFFFFDFSRCHGMALATGECDPGLQPTAAETHASIGSAATVLQEAEAQFQQELDQLWLQQLLIASLQDEVFGQSSSSAETTPSCSSGAVPCDTGVRLAQVGLGFLPPVEAPDFNALLSVLGAALPDGVIDLLAPFIFRSALEATRLHDGLPTAVNTLGKALIGGVAGITLASHIFLADHGDFADIMSGQPTLTNLAFVGHEATHVAQFLNDPIGFYPSYADSYIRNQPWRGTLSAYLNVSYEIMGRAMEEIITTYYTINPYP